MGLFILKGNREKLAPVAAKLGLPEAEAPAFLKDARWVHRFHRFPKSKRLCARQSRHAQAKAARLRPYDAGGNNDRSKAVEYARWLAKRDGVKIPAAVSAEVEFEFVPQTGLKSLVVQASRVCFSNYDDHVWISIPHVGYDPALPAVELCS
jgi:hypothetical protein